MCPSSWNLYLDDFPFIGSSLADLEPELGLFEVDGDDDLSYHLTLAREDGNSKLVDVVSVADEDRVGNNLLQIWQLRFGHNAKLLFRF